MLVVWEEWGLRAHDILPLSITKKKGSYKCRDGSYLGYLDVVGWEDAFLTVNSSFQPVIIHRVSDFNKFTFLEGELSIIIINSIELITMH